MIGGAQVTFWDREIEVLLGQSFVQFVHLYNFFVHEVQNFFGLKCEKSL